MFEFLRYVHARIENMVNIIKIMKIMHTWCRTHNLCFTNVFVCVSQNLGDVLKIVGGAGFQSSRTSLRPELVNAGNAGLRAPCAGWILFRRIGISWRKTLLLATSLTLIKVKI